MCVDLLVAYVILEMHVTHKSSKGDHAVVVFSFISVVALMNFQDCPCGTSVCVDGDHISTPL